MTEKPSETRDQAWEIVEIMELLAKEAVNGAGPTEISKRLSLDKATAFRRLDSLTKRGWLERTENGNYVPSVAFGRCAETVRKSYLAHADVITRRLAALDQVQPPAAE